MNITKTVVEMTTSILEAKLEKQEELSPSLISALYRLQEKVGELLSDTPIVRGWDLSGKDPRKFLKDNDSAVKVGDRVWTEKGVYFIWKGLLLTAVWGDQEMEQALSGLRTLDNQVAEEAWENMNSKEG